MVEQNISSTVLTTTTPQIAGIILLGTSMDYESDTSRSLGCWNAASNLDATIDALTTNAPTPSFALSDETADHLITLGFGADISATDRTYWRKEVIQSCRGDSGPRARPHGGHQPAGPRRLARQVV